MKTEKNLYASLRLDLSIGATFIKGINRPVRNCWHFSSDGNYAFAIFESESGFKAAMNRLALLTLRYKVIILAFCLMDNHIHLILYGSKAECEALAKEFLNLTAHYNSVRHHSGEGTSSIPVSHQAIEDEEYLLNAICYDLRNPPVSGLKYTYYDYPWSSGPLYFRSRDNWSSPLWTRFGDCPDEFRKYLGVRYAGEMGVRELKSILGSDQAIPDDWLLYDGMVLPSSFIPVEIVEELFRSHKAFNYFAGRNKEKEIEEMMGTWAGLNLQDSEMRQHRDTEMKSLFGTDKIRTLSLPQRIEIGKILRRKYVTSIKQIARIVRVPLAVAERMIR